MKNLFLTIALIISPLALAQSLKFGVKAGPVFNVDNGKSAWAKTQEIYTEKGSGVTGLQAGALLRASLVGIYIQPELLYTTYKNKYESDGNSYSVSKNRIDLPVAVGKKFLGVGHAQLGPVFSYYFDDNISLKDIKNTKQDNFSVGLHIGAGVEVSNVLFDLRYEFGFGKVVSDFLFNDTTYQTANRPKLLNLTVAYLF